MLLRRKGRKIVKYSLIVLFVITLFVVVRLMRYVADYREIVSLPRSSRDKVGEAKDDENIVPVWRMPRRAEKIDWHDYKAIEIDAKREGTGEHGIAVQIPDSKEKEALYKVNGFNAYLSDMISLNRSLPDIRHKGCKEKKYNNHLPTVSVVVPFHNEHFSTLLRTAYSVLHRSPKGLIKEIFLVDDASTKEHCKKTLDDYVKANLPNVHVIHLTTRSGLILARLAGAKEATGEVLLFLDSHTEATVNFLPPLLEPISEDYRTAVCPFIDVIDYETFQYRAQDEGARGAFDWEFYYKRLPLLPEDLKNPTEPFKSPIMAGGLFAISTKFFWELGGYDPGLDIWGGEQYELSFKIWQCGGMMVDAPCSRIGHIYRKYAPFPNPGHGDFIAKNYRRVAEVWMDEYKEYLYKRRPHYLKVDPGDLTEQRAIREKLKCKPFKWFMEEVAFDLPKHYPPVEPKPFASGEIRNVADPSLCVDSRYKDANSRFSVEPCIIGGTGTHGGEQQFQLTWRKDVRPMTRIMCWDVSSNDDRAPVLLWACHHQKGNQYWRYDPKKQWLIHGGNPRCLDCIPERKEMFVAKCDPDSKTQRWKFENINEDAIAKWDSL